MKNAYQAAIIGGGASGLVAAIRAARLGAKVIVLERMDRVGKKILVTGNSRCNLTNSQIRPEFYFGRQPEFAAEILKQFGWQQTLDFFAELGLVCRAEGDKFYPVCGQASAVLDVLRYELESLGVEVCCQAEVLRLEKTNSGFRLFLPHKKQLTAHKVILAAGGKSSPVLGSNGSGYLLAQSLGHSLIEPFPALVQLQLDCPYLKALKGFKFEGQAQVYSGEKLLASSTGEILFTDYGISGPAILNLSRTAGLALQRKQEVSLQLNLLTWMKQEKVAGYLEERLQQQGHKSLSLALVGFLHKRLIPVALKAAGFNNLNQLAAEISQEQLQNLAQLLTSWKFRISGLNGWSNSQVTAGGIAVREVNRLTLESKLVPGLYFAGEILDIDGACGGYNLQWAWACGWVAGKQAARN